MASFQDTSHLSWSSSSNHLSISGFSDRCRFEHPSQSALGSGNRFGVLSGGGFGGMSVLFLFACNLQQPAILAVPFAFLKPVSG